MTDSAVRRRGVLAIVASGLLPGCVAAFQDEEAELRDDWESRDAAPDRDEVNRRSEAAHRLMAPEVSAFMPVYAPLTGPVGARTNQHYDIELEAEDEVDIFVLKDEADVEDNESVVEEYLEGEFSHIPEYAATGVRSYSAFIHVPDEEDYALIVDFHDISQDRRHLEDPVPVDGSIEAYYYLPFDEFKARRTDD